MRTALVVLTAVLLAAAGGRPSDQTVFRGGIDLVQADAVVLDAQGRPVPTLKASDFTLLVDGQPRDIESVEYIDASATTPLPAGPSSASPAAGVRPPMRHVIFVADDGALSTGGARSATQAARKVLDRLGPFDRVALLSIPSGPAVDFTTEREPVRAALDKVVGRAAAASPEEFSLNFSELFAFDVGATGADRDLQRVVMDRECPTNMQPDRRDICQTTLQAEAERRLDTIHEQTRASVSGIDKLFRALGKMSGPKAVILISEGLLMRPDHRDESVIDSLGRQAALAGVTLYTVLLDRPSDDIGVSVRERAGSSSSAGDRAAEEDGLRGLSAASGGMLMRATGSPDAVFQRLSNALSGFYVVSFRALATDQEGPHKIKLAATDSALSTHARSEFVMTPVRRGPVPTAAASDSRRREPVSSVNIDKITLRVATRAIPDAGGTIRILFSVDVQEPAAHPVSALALGYKLTAGDRLIADTGRVVPVTHNADGSTAPISYIAFQGVPPGRYKLELSASDGSKHSGFVAHPVDAALHTIGAFRLSDLLVAASAPSAEGPFPVPASVTIKGSDLVVGVEVMTDDAAAFGDAAVRFEIVSAKGAPSSSFAEIKLAAGGPASQFVRTSLSIPDGGAHEYLARASLIVKGAAVGQVDSPFRTIQ